MMGIAIGYTGLVILTLFALTLGPWFGWNLALQYLYKRYCAHLSAIDPDDGREPDSDQLEGWERSLGDAHGLSMAQVWRQMLLRD